MFRVKIVLLSILLSGSILVVSGLYFLFVMNRVSIDRIDREILALGGSHLHVLPPRRHWQDLDTSLRFIYGEQRSKDLIVLIRGARNDVLYKSSNWPRGISEASFPDFDHEMDTGPSPDSDDGWEQGPPNFRYDRPFGPAADFDRNRDNTRDYNNNRMRRPPRPGERDERYRAFTTPSPAVALPGPLPPARIKKSFFQTIKTPAGSWRVGIMGNQRVTILLGMNLTVFYQDAERFQKAFLITVPIGLLLLAGGGWVIAHRAMKPVASITRTAEGITARALDQRIHSTDADRDLSRLVDVINSMLDRLQKSFGQAVRFSADAAHELQTPLTILQGELDDAVQHAPIGSEEQRRYGALLEEVQRLKTIVQKLLILAQADAGKLNLRMEQVDLSALTESAAEDAGVIAPHLRVEKQIAPEVMVKADPDLLRQVIQNLTSNAVKYNIEKGLIRFLLMVRGNKVHFTISNTGNPIPVKDQERVFDRFYRVDKSRSRAVPGAGLGLSLAREIVHAHRGDLRLDPGPNNMVTFTLSLPVGPH